MAPPHHDIVLSPEARIFNLKSIVGEDKKRIVEANGTKAIFLRTECGGFTVTLRETHGSYGKQAYRYLIKQDGSVSRARYYEKDKNKMVKRSSIGHQGLDRLLRVTLRFG